jgi:hypothetical protein
MTFLTLMRGKVIALALACIGLASCDQVQEAVDQAKTEAAKLQAQAEAEAKKLTEPTAENSSGTEQAGESQAAAGDSSTSGPASESGSPAAQAPAPPAAVNSAEVIQRFLALQPFERRDSHLSELAALDEASRDSIDKMELSGSIVTSQGLACLAKFPRIEHLDLRRVKVTAEDLAGLAELRELQTLLLDYAEVNDQELEELRPLAQLKTLSLTGTPVTDAGLAALRDMTALEMLVLSETSVTGGGIATLKCLPGLKHLAVANTSFGAGAEKVLRQTDQLEVLHASTCGMNDVALKQISGSRVLRELDLGNSPLVSDASAAQVAGCSELEFLGLASTRVGDPTLSACRRLKNLKQLNVMRTNCTSKGIAALQKSLPAVEIKYP